MASKHPLKILAADDIFVNQKMITLMLERMGYQCQAAGNGLEVLQALEKGGDFDLILMDVNMPEMDGLEATRRIVEIYGARRPRVVALTANVAVAEREMCAQAGMDDFLSKPLQIEELQNALLRCPARPTSTSSSPPVVQDDEVPLLDHTVLKTLRMMCEQGGPELLQQILDLGKRDMPGMIAKVQADAQGGLAPELVESAHSLKGSAANLGAKRLAKRCANLEKAAKAGEMELATQFVPGLAELWQESLAALEVEFPRTQSS